MHAKCYTKTCDPMGIGQRSLAEEFASQVQQATCTSSTTTAATATHLALHVELQSHLSSLSNGILLCSARVLSRPLATTHSIDQRRGLTVLP
jgi:DNA-directed RNA polymerase specialized sigma54-like protein